MRNKKTDKENIRAIVEAGEIYSRDFFVAHGKEGGPIGGKKRWEGKTPEERKVEMAKVRAGKKEMNSRIKKIPPTRTDPKYHKKFSKAKRALLGLPSNINNTLSGLNFTREIIRARDNFTCQQCGKKWKPGERRLDVHHKDFDKEKSKKYDNYEKEKDNLITLCHKCHLNIPEHKQSMRVAKRVIHSHEID